jgi:hypothetical protein
VTRARKASRTPAPDAGAERRAFRLLDALAADLEMPGAKAKRLTGALVADGSIATATAILQGLDEAGIPVPSIRRVLLVALALVESLSLDAPAPAKARRRAR